MNSVESIRKAISELLDIFPGASVSYEYKDEFDIHLLKVSPDSLSGMNDYVEITESIIDNFIDEYPGESIAFLSSDSMVKIENPTETFYGKDHFPESQMKMADCPSL